MKYICINPHSKFSTYKACNLHIELGEVIELGLSSGLYHSSEHGLYYNIMEFKTYYSTLEKLRDDKINSIIV